MFETVKEGPNKGQLVRLEIAAPAIREALLDWQKAGLTYTASGYGHIPTRYMVRTIDNRWRRVWSVCYSNNGTMYVRHGKTRTIVELYLK